jgi:PAS domain S-box-containing protein
MSSAPARPDWESWLTPDGRFTQIPPSFERITKRSATPDMEAADVLRLIVHPDDLARALEHLEAERVGDRGPAETEFRIVRPDGEVRWVHHCCEPVTDEAGRYLGTRASAHDITDLKRAQEALFRERSLLSSIMQATDVMLVYLDPAFNFVWVNPAYAATCRHRPEELIGKNHFALYPHPENEAIFRRVCETGQPVFCKDRPFEFPDQPLRGITYWDWSLVPMADAGGRTQGLVFSLRETTRYVRAEEALRRSEERFRLFMDNSPTIAWVKDESGRHVYISKTGLERFGWMDGWLGKTDAELWPAETAEAFRRNDLQVLTEGRPVQLIEETADREGSRCVWLNTKFPIQDAAGRRFVAGIGLDITAFTRAKEELAVAKATAEESRREAEAANQAKDRFIAMVSHELRTPLTPSMLALSLLRSDPRLPPDLRTQVELVARNLDLEARLIDDLLDVGRITSGKMQLQQTPIDIAAAIQEAARVVNDELEAKGQTLVVDTAGVPYQAVADEGRLVQVFWNLLRNSIKFSPAGSRIVIRARTAPAAAVPTGRELLVEVVDEGCGIDPRRLPRIFEPFEQEDRVLGHGGLGLGLNICRVLVTMHGGTIAAHSDGPGRGATFSVRLPLADGTQAAAGMGQQAATTGRPVEAAGARPLRVLLVEDDADSVTLMRLLLQQKGYEVATACRFASALAALNASEPDVLIADLGLPDGDGLDLPGELRSRGLATPAIALSGYGMEADIARSRAAGFAGHFVKPLKDVEQLVEAIKGLDLRPRLG